jgi:hypothetical protein
MADGTVLISAGEVNSDTFIAEVMSRKPREDGRLIAAAPEMLALLTKLAQCGKGEGSVLLHKEIDDARTLLAQVNGQ